MTTRKNELGTIKIVVKGTKYNDKAREDKRHFYNVTSGQLTAAFRSFIANLSFENSIIDIPESVSKIYQKIGLDVAREEIHHGVTYFQFAGKFILRDQENIKMVDTESFTTEEIVIDGNKYQYHQLHFSIIASKGAIISDTKCYNKNLEYYLRKRLAALLNEGDFQIDPSNCFADCINVQIKGDARKDYEDVLRNNFSKIQSFGLTFGKPNKALLESNEKVEKERELFDLFGDMFGVLVGVNTDEAESPFIGVKIELKFKEVPRGMTEVFKGYKRTLKTKLLELSNNGHFKEGRVDYLDDNDELQYAIRRGVTKNSPVQVDAADIDSNDHMWTEQIRAFRELEN